MRQGEACSSALKGFNHDKKTTILLMVAIIISIVVIIIRIVVLIILRVVIIVIIQITACTSNFSFAETGKLRQLTESGSAPATTTGMATGFSAPG